jgi:GST-like protein
MAVSVPLESHATPPRRGTKEIAMIEVYSWATPNGHKIHIMLEECGLAYRAIPIDIGAGAQFTPEFLKISPNNKIPALVDADGPDGKPISLFESGAILLYLATKTGRFLPADLRGRYTTLEWLMFQMGGVGPMLGQAHHFRMYAPEKIPYAIDRYSNEARRLYGVLDKRLASHAFVAGDEYTIADNPIFTWLRSWKNQGIELEEFPKVKAWFDGIAARPAVMRGVEVLAGLRKPVRSEQEREVLFGATQYQRR